MIVIQIIVPFLALLLVFLSLSLDPESHIFRFPMLRRLPVIRFCFKVSKGLGKLKVGGRSTIKESPSHDIQVTREGTLTGEDEGFKQLVSLLRNEGSMKESQKVDELILHDFRLSHMRIHDHYLNMVIDGAEELVCRPSSNQSLSTNELMELNRKRASRQLAYIMVFVAVLIFVLTCIHVICTPSGQP